MKLEPFIHKFQKISNLFRKDDNIYAAWLDYRNWGDALNPVLIHKISGKHPVLYTNDTRIPKNKPVFAVIGSILDNRVNLCTDNQLIIWGTGFISNKGYLKVRSPRICAVRGPLTRKLLLKQGFQCPDIFGDPALLYPRFYKPNINKKYKLGIIPHYIDKNNPVLPDILKDPDILIIDIQGGINEVVDNICSCQKIASSSLHGIIAADAYGIPSKWIQLSDRVIGDGFKFYDYFCSVGRLEEKPFIVGDSLELDELYGQFYHWDPDIDLKELWDSCPFIEG